MHKRIRRLAPLALALLGLTAAISVPGAVSASSPYIDHAKSEMIRLINKDRQDAGLVGYRVDSRLMSIAFARSYDMATKHYFSHRQPDGRTAFDMIDATGMTWYVAAEVIAWNNYYDLDGSAVMANNQWLASSSHRQAIMSTSYNYMGVGLAIDKSNGHRIWTAVFVKEPDHTGGWAKFNALPSDTTADTSTTTTTALSSGPRSVTLSWQGGDIRLQVLTSGFDHYQVKKKIDSNLWTWVSKSTTTRSRTLTVYPGHVYRLAVRACDHRGNCGSWAYARVDG
jgi:hypothetical protein